MLALTTLALVAAVPVQPAQVVAKVAHDRGAFTQGLVFADGKLWESTGLYGQSSLRQLGADGAVVRQALLPATYFAEGLAAVPGRLIQLTWREGVAVVWDTTTLTQLDTWHYDGEGWGLCFDGTRLVMSDGSDRLFFRDPQTFALTGQINVSRDGAAVDDLNELECLGGAVYANVWQRRHIVRIDPASGAVTHVVDGTALLSTDEARNTDVMNGLAYDSTSGLLWVTGKLWPTMFGIKLPVADAPGAQVMGGAAPSPTPSGCAASGPGALSLLALSALGSACVVMVKRRAGIAHHRDLPAQRGTGPRISPSASRLG